jgi:nicotinamidase-related amidase
MSGPRRALVIVDVQQEYFEGPLAIAYPPRDESLARILDALKIADEFGMPVVAVQHESAAGSPVFAPGSTRQEMHPALAERLDPKHKRITKRYASVFDGTDFASWCQQHDIDTITLVGYMTNNCILATAASAGPYGVSVEVLSDATGAINLSNEQGSKPAQQVHETLMVLLHSNFAAVTTTAQWSANVRAKTASARSNLIVSAGS